MGQSIEAEGTAGPSEGSIGSTPEGDHGIPTTSSTPAPAVNEDRKWIVWNYYDYEGWWPKEFNTYAEAMREHQGNIDRCIDSVVTLEYHSYAG